MIGQPNEPSLGISAGRRENQCVKSVLFLESYSRWQSAKIVFPREFMGLKLYPHQEAATAAAADWIILEYIVILGHQTPLPFPSVTM